MSIESFLRNTEVKAQSARAYREGQKDVFRTELRKMFLANKKPADITKEDVARILNIEINPKDKKNKILTALHRMFGMDISMKDAVDYQYSQFKESQKTEGEL